MKLFRTAAMIAILALHAFGAPATEILGGVSSTAEIDIDGTPMAPAPSWSVVDKDVIRTTSAPGLLLTEDRNAITFMRQTTVRVRTIPPGQTWIFVREGGLSVNAINKDVLICIANRLFQPATTARGTLILEKSGTVTSNVTSGVLKEVPVRACGEQLASGLVLLSAGAVAGGTATATAGAVAAATGTATAITGAAAGVSAGVATAVGFASSSSTCASDTGCNFNPAPITPSVP